MNRIYACIDLKSFYASVECVERNLDPITTNLVVADIEHTEKTICLAVTPALKKYGLSGRSRLFQVIQKVEEINKSRKLNATNKEFIGKSFNEIELQNNKDLELDYIVAKPRMKYYMDYSTKIYSIYLKYLSNEDMFSYSIDEIFCDLTNYLNLYKMKPRELITMIIKDVYETTGITATAGIGTNMYLAKVAMDIVAKHTEPNEQGVRIAGLDETFYKRILWNHKPLTDFWRVGKGYAKKLEENNIFTMGDIARCSINNEELLYKLFGVNAELLIDHAWGYEPCTIKDVKSYKPDTTSLSSGQVLHSPYNFKNTRIVVQEMVDNLVLKIVENKFITDHIVLNIGYDIENLKDSNISSNYFGEIKQNHYGKFVPKDAHGTTRLKKKTSSTTLIMDATMKLFDKIVDPNLLVRRINISFNNLVDESFKESNLNFEQYDLFTDYEKLEKQEQEEKERLAEERKLQHAVIDIKNKYGKNAILKGMNLQAGATAVERNRQIGGHNE